jgi:hypothetical protein
MLLLQIWVFGVCCGRTLSYCWLLLLRLPCCVVDSKSIDQSSCGGWWRR